MPGFSSGHTFPRADWRHIIADFYIKDDPEVTKEKRKLNKQYLDVNELDETLKAIENVIGNEETK